MSVNLTWSVLREPMYASVSGGKPALADRRLAFLPSTLSGRGRLVHMNSLVNLCHDDASLSDAEGSKESPVRQWLSVENGQRLSESERTVYIKTRWKIRISRLVRYGEDTARHCCKTLDNTIDSVPILSFSRVRRERFDNYRQAQPLQALQ